MLLISRRVCYYSCCCLGLLFGWFGLVFFAVIIVLFCLHCLSLLQLHRFVRLSPSSLKLFLQKYNISFSITFNDNPSFPRRTKWKLNFTNYSQPWRSSNASQCGLIWTIHIPSTAPNKLSLIVFQAVCHHVVPPSQPRAGWCFWPLLLSRCEHAACSGQWTWAEVSLLCVHFLACHSGQGMRDCTVSLNPE